MKATFEFFDPVGVITINNPPQNYLSTPEFLNLAELRDFININSCKGLIIKGAGRHFSAGADLSNLYRSAKDKTLGDSLNRGKEIINFLSGLLIPTIASVNGVCFGGGLEIALGCSIIVSSEKSLFAFPETNLNLMPGLCGGLTLTRRIGLARSLDMILSGDIMNAQRAHDLGIADYLTGPKNVNRFSMELMKRITDKPLKVINNVMQSLKFYNELPYGEAMIEETKLFCELALKEAKKNDF